MSPSWSGVSSGRNRRQCERGGQVTGQGAQRGQAQEWMLRDQVSECFMEQAAHEERVKVRHLEMEQKETDLNTHTQLVMEKAARAQCGRGGRELRLALEGAGDGVAGGKLCHLQAERAGSGDG